MATKNSNQGPAVYSRAEHAERIAATFGFDCAPCKAEIVRDPEAIGIGALVVARRDDGMYRIWATTTTTPDQLVRRLCDEMRRKHTLVHAISVLDTRALGGHLRRRLDSYLDAQRGWYELPLGVVKAVCATRHICEVPSPFLTVAGTASIFSAYMWTLERAIEAASE